MYSTSPWIPTESVPGGTTLLVRGPTMTGKDTLVLQLLAGDDGPDTGTVLVTTDDSPRTLWERYRELAPTADPRRVGIVNATGRQAGGDPSGASFEDGFSADGSGMPMVADVGSPADLTGVGMKTSQFVERLVTDVGVERVRLGLVSLNTMAMYADESRIAKFVHAVAGRLDAVGGFGLVVVHTDGLDQEFDGALKSFVDGAIDVRESEGGTEARLRGLGGATEWAPVDLTDPAVRPRADEPAAAAAVDLPDSLHALIATVEAERPTLTLCNVGDTGDVAGENGDADLSAVRSYFESRDVPVRTTMLGTDTPRDVALLHRGEQLLASTSVGAIADAIAVSESGTFAGRDQPSVLKALDDGAHAAPGVDRAFLVDASRVVEMAADRTGDGRLHAGFQDLSRLWDEPRTRRIYERVADAGVDVHVYGVGDAETPAGTGMTVHALDDEEIRRSWFVVHDGAGDPDRKAALVAEERDPDTYYGFWTRTPERVDAVDAYLRATYPA